MGHTVMHIISVCTPFRRVQIYAATYRIATIENYYVTHSIRPASARDITPFRKCVVGQ